MNKKLSFFLVAVMMLTMFASTVVTVSAAGDTIATATSISTGTQYSGSITSSNTVDYYKFTLSSSGRVNVRVTAYIYCTDYYIYDVNGDRVWSSTYQYWNSTSEQYNKNENVDLTSGTYYFCVSQNQKTGNYNFKLTFTSANESFKETTGGTNNTIPTASSISTGTQYRGQIACNDSKDFYRFTLSTSGRVNVRVTAYIYCTDYDIYDVNGDRVWSSTYQYWNSTQEQYDKDENVDLTSGTYYFCVSQNQKTGNYNFKLTFTSANESFKETTGGTNNTIPTASSISIGTQYRGQIACNDSKDFFKFTTSGKINIRITTYIYCTNFYIYNANGDTVWSSTYQYWNATSEQYDKNVDVDLSSGTYYFCVSQNQKTGNYQFTISSSTPSIYTLTYDANGSGVTNMPDNPSSSTNYTIPSTVPERFGYTFLGWSKSSSATSATYKPGSTITPTANTTLYAVWKAAISISNDSSTSMTVEFGNQAWYYKFVPSSSGTYVFETTGSLDTHGYLYTSSSSNLLKGDDDSGSDYNFKIEYDLTSGTTYYLKAKAHSSTATGSTTIKVYKKTTSTYTVTYNANGGSVSPTSTSVTAGSSVTLPTPTKSYKITYNANGGSGAPSAQTVNLTCKGWSTSTSATSASYSCGYSYKPDNTITLYAVWNSPVSATLSSAKPTYSDRTFLGWSTSSNATSATYTASSSISLSGNVTLYAVWSTPTTPSNAKLVVKTPKIVLSTRWEALGVCAFTITGQSGNYNVTWSTADSSIVTAYNNATEIDDNVLGFTLSANNPGTTTITLKLYNNGNLLDTKTVNVEVIASYYTDSIRVRYNSYQSLNWNDGFSPDTFESDNEYVASVDEETGEVYGYGRGTTYIMAMDYYGNTRMVRVEVYYTLWQWIIMILLFGWIWY